MLISKKYKELNTELHISPEGFGHSGYKWAYYVAMFIHANNKAIDTVLDYGAGSGSLKNRLEIIQNDFEIDFNEYDPAVSAISNPPFKADMVCCTDVLEHIEPECLDNVLGHICSLMNKIGFLTISLIKANQILPDGRNAHLIVENKKWWIDRLINIGFIVEELYSNRPTKDLVLLVRK